MRRGGTGGSSTLTGKVFEYKTSLEECLKLAGYTLVERLDIRHGTPGPIKEVYKDNELYGILLEQDKLYYYLESLNINYKDFISNKQKPDECFINFKLKTVYIIEKKSQSGEGSTDEKLAVCDYKLKQYKKVFSPLGYDVKWYFLLDEWFKTNHFPKKKDLYNYVKECGCEYYFDEVPLKELGLEGEE